MRRSRRFTPTLILCCALLATHGTSAQQPAHSHSSRTSSSGYGGGGVRGATPDAPDGFLVSADEAVSFNGLAPAANDALRRTRSIGPELAIVTPKPGQTLQNPITLEVAMPSLADTPLDLAGVRVLYGTSKVDITARTQALTQATAGGFSLSGLKLPPGKHPLVIEVQDAKGQRAQVSLTLDVN